MIRIGSQIGYIFKAMTSSDKRLAQIAINNGGRIDALPESNFWFRYRENDNLTVNLSTKSPPSTAAFVTLATGGIYGIGIRSISAQKAENGKYLISGVEGNVTTTGTATSVPYILFNAKNLIDETNKKYGTKYTAVQVQNIIICSTNSTSQEKHMACRVGYKATTASSFTWSGGTAIGTGVVAATFNNVKVWVKYENLNITSNVHLTPPLLRVNTTSVTSTTTATLHSWYQGFRLI